MGERLPLSFNQEFLCLFDQGDDAGPFGPRYNIIYGWRVRGPLDLGALRGALDDVVARHESLRTVIVRDGASRYQQVLPPTSPALSVRDLSGAGPDARDRAAEELLIELDAGSYGSTELPLLRAVVGRFDEQDAVLALIVHHTAADGWGMLLLMRDLAARYAARRGLQDDELPPVRQYGEYALWEREWAAGPAVARSRRYWREALRGARMLPIRTDHPRSAGLPKTTAMYRFLVPADETALALKFARETRSSPFMVLLAVYQVLLHRMTGANDIVVPTLSSGRGQARFHETVGSFFNFVPFRTDISGARTFREVAARTRRSCLAAFTHEIPFPLVAEEAPELNEPFASDDLAVCAFQVFQFPFSMEGEKVGDLEYSEIRRRLMSQADSTDIPDGALFILDVDPAGDMIGNLGYNTNLFDGATIADLVAQFRRTLRETLGAPDAPLGMDG